MDLRFREVDYFQELLTQDEIDDQDRKEEEYSMNEEMNSLDIDDYDQDDDIDYSAEALDYDNT